MAFDIGFGQDGKYYRVDIKAGGEGLAITEISPPASLPPGVGWVPTIRCSDIIKRALRKLGVGASGETLDAATLEDGRAELNALLDSWNTEKLIAYSVNRDIFTLTGGQAQYTLGPGGDFSMNRPNDIEYCYFQLQSNSVVIDVPVKVLTAEEWAAVNIKALPVPTVTWAVYYNSGYPLGTLNVWPVPTDPHNIVLGTLQKLNRFQSINDQVTLPDGYERALVYNLAIELASEYGKQIPVEVAAVAIDSKAAIKRMNMGPLTMRIDAPGAATQTAGTNYMRIIGG